MSSMKTRVLAAALACSAMCQGCFHAEDSAVDSQCKRLVTTFFRLPPKDQIAEFPKRDLENQYAVLICGNQALHPPAIYLAEPFAHEGSAAVVFLKEKLSKPQGDLTVRDIVAVLSEMRRQQTYNVAADADLMRLVEERIASMKDDTWKRYVEQQVREFRAAH